MSRFILSAFLDEIDPDFKTQMDVLELHQIRYIEIHGVNGRNIVEHTLSEIKNIKEQIDERGFKISSIGSPIGKIKITDDFTPHLERFKKTLEAAHILASKYIRMFSFFIPEGENPFNHRDEVLKRWGKFVDIAKDSGVMLLHENEKDIYGDTAARCLDLLDTLNCGYVKAVFDPANFVQCGEEAYPYAFNVLKKHIVYLHVKDARSSDHVNVPAGEGDGKFPEILKELKESGYEGFVSLEPHLGMFVGLAALEPGTIGFDLPEGGQRSFAIAVNALRGITSNL